VAIFLRIKQLRERAGLSQEELARRVGISLNAMQSWEYGRVKSTPFDTLQKVCEILQCEPGDVIGIDKQDIFLSPVDNKSGNVYDRVVVNRAIEAMENSTPIKARDEGIVILRVFVTKEERDAIFSKCKDRSTTMAHVLRMLALAWVKVGSST
jgi:DNA-binding Xre family transcriptional regulator